MAEDFISKIKPGEGPKTPLAFDFKQPGYTDSLRNIRKNLAADTDIVKRLTGGEVEGPVGGFDELIDLQMEAGKIVGTPFIVTEPGISTSSITGIIGSGLAADLSLRVMGLTGKTLKTGKIPDIMPKLDKIQEPKITDILDVKSISGQDITPITIPDITLKISPIEIPNILPVVTPIITPIVTPIITPVITPVITPIITQLEETTTRPPSTFGFPSLIPSTGKPMDVMDFVFGSQKKRGGKQVFTGEPRQYLKADVKKILKRMGF